MKTLLARALAGGDIRQAIRCAQQIVAIAGCDSRVVESLPDEWIGAVLRQAATLGLPGVAKQKPLAGLAVALLHTDVSLQNAALREWNARVEMCTDAVFAEVAVPNADEIRADIKTAARHGRFAVRSEQVQPMAVAPGRVPRPRTTAAAAAATAAADIRQPGKVGNWIASDGGTEIKRGASLDQLERWYGDYRARGEIPPRAALSKMIIGAIRHGARKLWEPIVRDHMPEYLARLDDDRASQSYSQLIWSHAIYGYASLGEVEEAMAYFWRLVDAKSYPTANGTAALLGCLLAPAHPLPVIPRGWDGPAYPVRNMKPAYPPRGESPSDRFIVPKSDADRQRLVAETGLAMLYASLRHGIWPTQYFYCVLLSALSLARMVGDLRHVFATVIPTTVRKMPPHFRINQVFLQSPLAWSIAIQGAAASGERALAEHWFKEYRMSAMPLFREPSSAYSRFTDRGLPAYARLFLLAQPYYTIPKLRRLPALADGTAPPESWYDLQEVETQLQMDRLRALDKLPLPFSGAYRMLLIYAGVDEHRNMDSAEAVAGEIEALSQDKLLPRGVVPRGRLELARCWKQVVMGYVAVFQQQRADLALTCAPQSDIRRTQERIVHWYQRWSADFERSGACAGNRTAGNAALGADVVRLARELRQGLSASQ
ncbi:hypothetical protein LPJ61_004873 [Coemansia biformis]|uniref:Uncharacterized protein n=1 Tax=Coemansia biformis TaxID=1286918 RepID=A0A9W7YB01_9FUNG|nr:hypothetical protein LPJ61_004873 [Coemansia biformis]